MEEMRPTSVDEYRKGKSKVVKCSSGHVFEIRKMTVPALVDLYQKLGVTVPEGTPIEKIEEVVRSKINEPGSTESIVRGIIAVLPRCIIQPKVTATGGEDSLSVDDIEPGDMFELFDEIMEFSGVSRMAEDLRQKFRPQSDRASSG